MVRQLGEVTRKTLPTPALIQVWSGDLCLSTLQIQHPRTQRLGAALRQTSKSTWFLLQVQMWLSAAVNWPPRARCTGGLVRVRHATDDSLTADESLDAMLREQH